jgi:hypothetical protein
MVTCVALYIIMKQKEMFKPNNNEINHNTSQ